MFLGFPCGSAGTESAWNARELGLIPGLGRSPGEGKGYPLQYSGLENCMDCIVHGVTKSRTWLSDFHFHRPLHSILYAIDIIGITYVPILKTDNKTLLSIIKSNFKNLLRKKCRIFMLFACYKSSEFPPGIIFLQPGECFFHIPCSLCLLSVNTLSLISSKNVFILPLFFFFWK